MVWLRFEFDYNPTSRASLGSSSDTLVLNTEPAIGFLLVVVNEINVIWNFM